MRHMVIISLHISTYFISERLPCFISERKKCNKFEHLKVSVNLKNILLWHIVCQKTKITSSDFSEKRNYRSSYIDPERVQTMYACANFDTLHLFNEKFQ